RAQRLGAARARGVARGHRRRHRVPARPRRALRQRPRPRRRRRRRRKFPGALARPGADPPWLTASSGGGELPHLTLTQGDPMAQLQIPLDAQRFSKGMTWKEYVAQMGDTRARTEENYAKAKLTDDERKFFSGLNQVKHVLMLAENWCG